MAILDTKSRPCFNGDMEATAHIAGPVSGPVPSGIFAHVPQRHWAECSCGWTSPDVTSSWAEASGWADAHLAGAS